MPARPRLIAGNWKMNGTDDALAEIAEMAAAARALPPHVTVAVCPPATLIDRARVIAGTGPLVIGAQDVHAEASGAFTGSVSAAMLHDAGATLVIVGHSERRAGCFEVDADVRAKAEAVLAARMTAIVCVGEKEAERDAGTTLAVIAGQLDGSLPDRLLLDGPLPGEALVTGIAKLAVAYEPVWAIGTGRTPTSAQVAEVHAAIRASLVARYGKAGQGIAILYGGSVKPSNAAELMAVPDVDGALVGGASLTAADFLAIVRAA